MRQLSKKKARAGGEGKRENSLLSPENSQNSLNYGFLWSALGALFYFRFHFIISFSLVCWFGDIFSSLACKESRYRQLLRCWSRIYHAIFQITFFEFSLLPPPGLTQIYILRLSIVYVLKTKWNKKSWEHRQHTIFSPSIFYPLVKLNGNYFPLNIQHRRKFIMGSFFFVTRCW